jgi:outer membrane protein assembly factor BamB
MKNRYFTNILVSLIIGLLLLLSFNIGAVNLSEQTFHEKTLSYAPLDLDWWPMFRHDFINTGFSTNTPPITNDILWTYQTNDGISATPAIVHGKVYVASEDFTLYCIEMDTGSLIWEFQSGGRLTSSPTVINNRVYLGSRDSNIYCLDATDGSIIWSYSTGFYIESSPLVKDGRLYIGSADGFFYCLDSYDGSLLWKYDVNNIIWSTPALYQGYIYFGALNGIFYCLDANTGTLIWEYSTDSGIWSSPAIYNNQVFIGSNDYNLYCFNALTGDVEWTFSTDNEIHSSPAIAYDKLYIGNNEGILYCLDTTNGNELWTYTISGRIQSSPAIADNKLYIGYEACCGSPSFVACLDAHTGSEIWDYNIGIPGMKSSPAIIMEKLVACSLDGIIRVFGNTPFLADAQGPYHTIVNTTLQFNGMAYGGVPEYSWYWNFGDGTTSTEQNPTHIYTTEETFTVTLQVTDSTSASVSDETIAVVTTENIAPNAPQISGSTQGKTGVEYTYGFQSIDPENDDVYYWVNWGDSCPAVEWEGPYQSGETLYLTHTYEEQGTFTIRSKTKDIHDLESEWGYFETSMPTPTMQKIPNPIRDRILSFIQNLLIYGLNQRFVLKHLYINSN